jgi:hypothetical protein
MWFIVLITVIAWSMGYIMDRRHNVVPMTRPYEDFATAMIIILGFIYYVL